MPRFFLSPFGMLKHGCTRSLAWLPLCSWFLVSAISAHAQFADPPYVIDVWPGGQGLPQSSVISIVQSRNGYLWLGTLNGLARFDGVHFTVFREGTIPGLSGNRVLYLFEDSHTNLWVGTANQNVTQIRREGQVQKVDLGSGSGRLVSACEDRSGAIWLYLSDGRLFRYQDGKAVMVNATGSGTHHVVIAEKSGSLWIGTDNTLVELNPGQNFDPNVLPVQQILQAQVELLLNSRDGGHWRMANRTIQKWKDNRLEMDLRSYPAGVTNINAACEDANGNLVVGTQDHGIYRFENPWNPTRISTAEGLSQDTVLSVCTDSEGDIWAGTDGGGLNRIKPRQFRVLEGSQQLVIQSVCEDRNGGVWFANYYGGKLFHWKGGRLMDYGANEGLNDPNLRSVFVDRSNEVWVGSTLANTQNGPGGLFHLQNDAFRHVDGSENLAPFSAIFQDRQGRLWFGSRGGLAFMEGDRLKAYSRASGMSADSVKAIADDPDGNLWVGTENGGLNCFRDGKFTIYRQSDKGLPSDNISALWCDADGVLWVGTSAGLARLEKGRWTRYTTHDGLGSDSINYFVEEGDNLWMGTFSGILRVSKKSLTAFANGSAHQINCRVYGRSDGMPTPECVQGSQPAACRTSDGRLWFGTTKGLVTVKPVEMKQNSFLPPVKIESVLVEGAEQKTNTLSANQVDSVTIPPGQERLEINYTSLNLGAADQSRFQYWLEGHEKGWTDVGNSRVARFNNLPPGHFNFHVRAANEDGVWNETGDTISVIVEPPFWRTNWFVGVVVAGVLGTVVAIVHNLSTQKLHREVTALKQQEALEQERARIARDLHDQLGANLMQVALLGDLAESDKESPAEVETHARQISQTARETTKALDEIVWAVNPSNDTLDGLVTYVCKYAQEYFEMAGLRYRLDVPAELPGASLPPEVRHNVFLAAKEAINNVVKHAQAAAAWIRLRLESDRFTLEIEDDGRGADAAGKPGRNGLRNMRKRMEDIGGSFFIGPALEHGTLVRLTAPIR
jgi:signal transduction histidine kinase/ligand-binding sensor domain-containing protein